MLTTVIITASRHNLGQKTNQTTIIDKKYFFYEIIDKSQGDR